MWEHSTLTLAGSPMDTATNVSLEINEYKVGKHYNNGSRVISVPYSPRKDYTLNVTMDLDGQDAMWLYEQYYKGGSTFNGTLDMNADITAVGSKHTTLILSGCEVTDMPNPSSADADTTETTLEIIKSTLESGEDVLINGFGKFKVMEKDPRKGRNPRQEAG